MPACKRGDERRRRVTNWVVAKDVMASEFGRQGPTGLGLDKEEWATTKQEEEKKKKKKSEGE